MRHAGAGWLALLAAAPLALRAPARAAAPYPDVPPPAHTGGFGEPTCARCHFDQPAGDSLGGLVLRGLPAAYTPGERYRLALLVTRPGLRRGGFQMAARFAEGGAAGGAAGSLRALDARVRVTRLDSTGVDYAHHTRAGTEALAADTARWEVEWTAPAAGGPVVLHIAANAADGDDSPLGDHLYLKSARTRRR